MRVLRRARGLTQEDMAEHGFAVRHYQRIEAGRSVSLQTIWKLARAFGVSPRVILPDTVSTARAPRARVPRSVRNRVGR
jgi:transcriptional regulator with XRE-family HTH domain